MRTLSIEKEMDCSDPSPQVEQSFGTRRVIRRTAQTERKIPHKKEEHSHAYASFLPPVAGIMSHSNIRPFPASFELRQNTFSYPEEEKQFNEFFLSRDDVIHRLRHSYQQPTTMFGEDDEARLLRLKYLNSGCPTNENHNALPLDLVEFKRNDKNTLSRRDNRSKKKGADDIDDGLGACNVDTSEGVQGKISEVEHDADHKYMKTHFDALCNEDKILVFFRQLLIEWEGELQMRPESEKRTDKGRSNSGTLEQCEQNLAPLIRMCRERILSLEMRQALLCIVMNCLQRDYLAAMDQYVKLSLYNAPCPIGITMGDSVRRAKSSSNDAARISIDVITCKFLQSVKRLITLCQRRYPIMLFKPLECNGISNGNGVHSPLKQEVSRMGNHIAGGRIRGVMSVNSSSHNNGRVL